MHSFDCQRVDGGHGNDDISRQRFVDDPARASDHRLGLSCGLHHDNHPAWQHG